ncbi:hypothetical protein AX14_000412 [Amanita brunnescens Koide BX004]|nr:hypothetical protein AX14_000412 [Amanita brunnescens Koide BX004]
MLTMCWGWFLFTIALLLVQPTQALHNYHSISNVARSEFTSYNRALWLRTLSLVGRSIQSGTSPATIVAIVLVLVALTLGALISFLWFSKRRKGQAAGYSSIGGLGWWSKLRYSSGPPDVEKGVSSSFHSRFAALRSAGREKFNNRLPPQVIVEEPPAPLLPHIQRYPSNLERMGDSGVSSLLTGPASKNSQSSRALAPLAPIRGSGMPARPTKSNVKSPTDSSWRKELQDAFSPPLREVPLEAISPQDLTPTSPVPLDSPPDTSSARDNPLDPAVKPRRQHSNRNERVRALHMDLTQDFRALESPLARSATMQVPNSRREDTSQLRKAKTVKSARNLRFMLPSSPRSAIAPLRSALGVGGNSAKSNLRPLLSASRDYSQDWTPPKTAFL